MLHCQIFFVYTYIPTKYMPLVFPISWTFLHFLFGRFSKNSFLENWEIFFFKILGSIPFYEEECEKCMLYVDPLVSDRIVNSNKNLLCGHNEKENMYRHEYVLENFDVNNKTDDAYSEMKYARAPN